MVESRLSLWLFEAGQFASPGNKKTLPDRGDLKGFSVDSVRPQISQRAPIMISPISEIRASVMRML
jgi:hypothetical protein